jgi:hypothetical protein
MSFGNFHKFHISLGLSAQEKNVKFYVLTPQGLHFKQIYQLQFFFFALG